MLLAPLITSHVLQICASVVNVRCGCPAAPASRCLQLICILFVYLFMYLFRD